MKTSRADSKNHPRIRANRKYTQGSYDIRQEVPSLLHEKISINKDTLDYEVPRLNPQDPPIRLEIKTAKLAFDHEPTVHARANGVVGTIRDDRLKWVLFGIGIVAMAGLVVRVMSDSMIKARWIYGFSVHHPKVPTDTKPGNQPIMGKVWWGMKRGEVVLFHNDGDKFWPHRDVEIGGNRWRVEFDVPGYDYPNSCITVVAMKLGPLAKFLVEYYRSEIDDDKKRDHPFVMPNLLPGFQPIAKITYNRIN